MSKEWGDHTRRYRWFWNIKEKMITWFCIRRSFWKTSQTHMVPLKENDDLIVFVDCLQCTCSTSVRPACGDRPRLYKGGWGHAADDSTMCVDMPWNTIFDQEKTWCVCSSMSLSLSLSQKQVTNDIGNKQGCNEESSDVNLLCFSSHGTLCFPRVHPLWKCKRKKQDTSIMIL